MTGGINPFVYAWNDPIDFIDPWGLDPSRLYPNQKFNPTNKVPKVSPQNIKFVPGKPTPVITPKNYNTNGINNLPGKRIPDSDNISKCKKGMSETFNLFDKITKILQSMGGGLGAPIIISVNPDLYPNPNFTQPNQINIDQAIEEVGLYDPIYNPGGVL